MNIAILGATGSIGTQTLDVVRTCLPEAQMRVLTGYGNIPMLAALAEEFRPELVWVPDGDTADTLSEMLRPKCVKCEILTGDDGLIACAEYDSADVVVNALVGKAGLAPTLAAIEAGKDIALANKESLVTAGGLIMGLAREKGVRIVPIDSEHSAILQCLQGNMPTENGFAEKRLNNKHVGNDDKEREVCSGLLRYAHNDGGADPSFRGAKRRNNPAITNDVSCVHCGDLVNALHSPLAPRPLEKIILTASGGPFRTWSKERIAKSTAADALRHPNWAMGPKITIDSATLMNKGLELIEAIWLFNQPLSNVEILVHPQSIIHSMVQFIDGAVMAQLGPPDMRLPILYALAGPARIANDYPRLDFLTAGDLTFEPPDTERFPCLALAQHAAKMGGTLPAVMNAINEWAVGEFLADKIGFYDISELIAEAFGTYTVRQVKGLSDIREAEDWADGFIKMRIKG